MVSTTRKTVPGPSQGSGFQNEGTASPHTSERGASTESTIAVDADKQADTTQPSSSALEAVEETAEKKDPPEEQQRPKTKIALIMLGLCMAVFLAALDQTIITTALPTIATDFNASEADYTWIGSAYLLAAAASVPSWGKISDIFGRKPIILIANVVFLIGSLICGLSINIRMLIGGRVIQGIGGGGLLVLVNICISDLFSMRTRGVYFGIVGMVWALASAVGPVLGGVFTQLVSWRWCFYVNLPCDGAAFIILVVFLDIETPRTPIVAGLRAIDWMGSIAIVGGTVMFLLGLEFGGISYPWSSATTICLIVFGAATIGIFFLIEFRIATYPIMPLRIFRRRSNVAALATCFVHGFVFISGSYFLPLYFQAVLGASPLLSGVYLFPFVISLSLVSAAVGLFIRKTGQYLPPIWAGMAFMAFGFGLYINLPAHADWARIVLFQIVAGIGVGPNFQAPLIALQSLIRPQDVAAATSTFGFTRNLSTSISVVIGGVIFQNQMANRANMLAGAGLSSEVLARLAGGSAGSSTDVVAALPDAQRRVVLQAYNESLRALWIFYTAVAVVGLGISLMIGKQTLSKEHKVTRTGLAAQEDERKVREREKKKTKGGPAGGHEGEKDVERGGAGEASEETRWMSGKVNETKQGDGS